jgi:hypothetical protein
LSNISEKINTQFKTPSLSGSSSEEEITNKIFSPLVGEHWKNPRWRPHKGRLPDHQRHTTLDLIQRRELRCSYSPCLGGPVGCHLAEAHQPPPERDDSPGVVLADDGRQADPSLSEGG